MKSFMEKWVSSSTATAPVENEKARELEDEIDTFDDLMNCDMDLK